MFTSLTVPLTPWVVMKSPALKGLKIRRMIPPAKFWTVPLKAIPIAIPPAARMAASEVVLIPRVPMVMSIRMTVRVMLTRLITNEDIVLSVFRLMNIFPRALLITLISQAPTM